MQTLRVALLALALLALAPLTAGAQVIAGSSLFFDHTVDEQGLVEKYRLCVGSECRDIGVTRVGTSVTLTGTLPSWVPRGRQDLTIQAIWKAPWTGSPGTSNTLSVPVVGPPFQLRTSEVPQ